MTTPLAADTEPPAPSPAEDTSDTKGAFVRGSMWSLVGYGGSQLMRLCSQIILWHTLYPEAFGLMTLVNTFMIGLLMFSEVGVGPSIVQNARGDDQTFLDTAWTIQVIRGVVIFFIACACALPVASFYGEPQLSSLVPVVALSAIVGGLHSTKIYTATRKVQLARVTVVDLVAQLASLVIMVTLALTLRSVWALAWGGVIGEGIQTLATHLFLPGRNNRFRWDKTAVAELARFGRWVLAGTILTFLAVNADRLIFGKLLSFKELGIYGVAVTWAGFVAAVLGHISGQVVFPLLSRARHEGRALRPFFLEARRPMLFAGAWLASCLTAGGPALLTVIYGAEVGALAWMVQMLAVAEWLSTLENVNSQAMLALGQPKWGAAANAAKVIGMAAFIAVGFRTYGVAGAIAGLIMADMLKYAVSAFAVQRAGLGSYAQDLLMSAGIAAATGAGVLGPLFLHRLGLPGWLAGFAWSENVTLRVAAFVDGVSVFLIVSPLWGAAFLVARRARPGVAGLS